MRRTHARKCEEARRLFLTGEMDTNAEIAARLGVKPHTIGKWRRDENWDSLRRKIDVRAGELFAEKIASERTSLSLRHYKFWEALLAKTSAALREKQNFDTRELERMAAILEKAQKGQRLAKGLADPETEEAIRAQGEADSRRLVDMFIDSVQRNVTDEGARDRIRKTILASISGASGPGAREPEDPSVQ